ncbi:MAG: hypothetical protein V5A66_02010, partial [Candidatus Thermoplasmatota archaeon]
MKQWKDLKEIEEYLDKFIDRYFRYSLVVFIIIILSLSPIIVSFVGSERVHSQELYSLDPPENLEVEHSDPTGEVVENGIFEEDYDPWELTRLQDGGTAEWDNESNTVDGSGSLHIQAVQTGEGNTTEEAYWEQDIVNTSSNITVNGAFNKSISEVSPSSVDTSVVEIQVNDTEENWQTIYRNENTEDTGWIEFGPNKTYEPKGKVTSVKVYMHLVADGGPPDKMARGDIWVDDISVVSEGGDHNLLTWNGNQDNLNT